MAIDLGTARRVTVLPEGVAEFLHRRAAETVGLGLIVAGAALLAALATYTPTDPSWNTASDGPTANLLGGPGAHAADALAQLFGLCAVLPGLALAGWGWRLIRRHGIDMMWLRVTSVPLTLLLGAGALAAVPAPSGWPFGAGTGGAGMGGAAGTFLLHYENALAAMTGLPGAVVPALFGALGLALLPGTLGVPWGDWRAVGMAAWRGASAVGTLARRRRAETADTPRKRAKPNKKPAKTARRKAPAELVEAAGARAGKREGKERQGRLELAGDGEAELPPLSLLVDADQTRKTVALDDEALEQNARLLETVLEDFSVHGQIVRVRQGPVVTRYELEPAPGTRSARVIALADDIARSMSAISARVAVVPGHNVIGIELPNASRETVYLRELLGSADFERSATQLPLALGKDISGAPVIADLARMPHLLVAGTTGSGKSVAVNSMILSLLYRLRPDECRFIMIDPKMLELSDYDGIPHLLHPVVTDPHKAVVALKWAVKEMNERYRAMSNLNVRNITGYNKRLSDAKAKGEQLSRTVQTGFDPDSGQPIYEQQDLDMVALPMLVVVVDEMADLMLVAGKEIEIAVQSLAQKARAAGIHLIIATQRPSVDVITGTIKANLPTRISFQVTSKIDSRTILGEQGAEQLLGQGDMLYMAGGGQINRVHGPFVGEREVADVASFLRQQGEPNYLHAITEDADGGPGGPGGDLDASGGDALYDRAIDLVSRERKASTSFIQRHLQIGYNRAARIIEQMEAEGVVTKANHVGKREVLTRDPGDDY